MENATYHSHLASAMCAYAESNAYGNGERDGCDRKQDVWTL